MLKGRRQGHAPTLLLRLVDDDTEDVILDTQLHVDALTPSFIEEGLLAYFHGHTGWNLQAVQDWEMELDSLPPRLIVFVQAVRGG